MDINKIPNLQNVEPLIAPETEMVRIPELAAELIAKQGGARDRFPIGFGMFNKIMAGGISSGDLVIVSGPSGHGKTTFAQTINYHLNQLGIPTTWFSYEIPVDELWAKFVAMGMDPKFFEGYAPRKLTSGNVEWIEQKILESVLKFNTKVVFIDHIGFLTPKIAPTQFEGNLSAYLGQLARQIKSLALEQGITVVLLAHTRKTKEDLQIDDIAHSIGIAQEADFVFMVEREKLKVHKINGDNTGDTFGPNSRISLVKNRRTGQNKFLKAEFKAGRLQDLPAPDIIL